MRSPARPGENQITSQPPDVARVVQELDVSLNRVRRGEKLPEGALTIVSDKPCLNRKDVTLPSRPGARTQDHIPRGVSQGASLPLRLLGDGRQTRPASCAPAVSLSQWCCTGGNLPRPGHLALPRDTVTNWELSLASGGGKPEMLTHPEVHRTPPTAEPSRPKHPQSPGCSKGSLQATPTHAVSERVYPAAGPLA